MSAKIEDGLTAKQRHAKRKHEGAPLIDCACGCGEKLKAFDRHARPATFVNGHNKRRYTGKDATRVAATMRWKARNPAKVREAKIAFYQKRKTMAVELKGSECVYCGLKHDGKNSAVFDFHHLDPAYKEANISKMLTNVAWERTVKELEQCVLACANCHRMIHNQGG